MQSATSPTEIFLHVRVIMAIVLGVSITRLLTGVARFVQHPRYLKTTALDLIRYENQVFARYVLR